MTEDEKEKMEERLFDEGERIEELLKEFKKSGSPGRDVNPIPNDGDGIPVKSVRALAKYAIYQMGRYWDDPLTDADIDALENLFYLIAAASTTTDDDDTTNNASGKPALVIPERDILYILWLARKGMGELFCIDMGDDEDGNRIRPDPVIYDAMQAVHDIFETVTT